MKRKICVVTGTRAEYGLLKNLIQLIDDNEFMHLQLIATGMHLSQKHGFTYKQIEKDGFSIEKKIEILSDEDTPLAVAEAMSRAISRFARVYAETKPDVLVVLGDRFEIFSAVAAAQLFRIPVAHLHGGELTEGLIDEAFRHSITKMSHLHFVATDEYRNRVIQLGEEPSSVFLVGGLGVDAISGMDLLNKNEIEKTLNLKFSSNNLLVTFHPVTLDDASAGLQINEILNALSHFPDTSLIFTLPNSDPGNNAVFRAIREYVSTRENAYAFESLGDKLYLSCLAQVDGVLGNSSSGLTEAPSFKIGTINVGDRQRGRVKAKSVIDCEPEAEKIVQALQQLYSNKFKQILNEVKNPYGTGGASQKILQVLEKIELQGLIKKQFHDLVV
jgi:GDP/UDP-N,N'-diacetylbacillosamine 2-epimerase (hydrolysing)